MFFERLTEGCGGLIARAIGDAGERQPAAAQQIHGAGHAQLHQVLPNAWRIVEGKLYLNVNKDIHQKRWLEDLRGHIAHSRSEMGRDPRQGQAR